jgi:hypothetical protein
LDRIKRGILHSVIRFGNMSDIEEIHEFVNENTELLARVLACGTEETRAYALALVANSGDPERVEEVQRELEQIRRDLES